MISQHLRNVLASNCVPCIESLFLSFSRRCSESYIVRYFCSRDLLTFEKHVKRMPDHGPFMLEDTLETKAEA